MGNGMLFVGVEITHYVPGFMDPGVFRKIYQRKNSFRSSTTS